MRGCDWVVGRSSFSEEKAAKKLCALAVGVKVFCFFFTKKKTLSFL
jgi:hypothetical protein